MFILNIWACRNYLDHGRYELIPRHHAGQRWAVPSTINPDNVVSDEYRDILNIFLKTREDLLARAVGVKYRKSSLLENRGIERINNYFRPPVSGYLLYRDSEEELLRYYNLEKTPDGIRSLNEILGPFYDEIAVQNSKEIRRLRIYSLLYSFKHISPTLPGTDPINLNLLPSVVLKAYKLLFIFMVVLTYAGSAVHIIYILRKEARFRQGFQWIMLYSMIWYFPAINWYANVLGDANRFRYPADLVITGLFVGLCYIFIHRSSQTDKLYEFRQTTE
jgi:hypothetical protein